MRWLREHPVLATSIAFGIAAGGVVGIAAAWGFTNFAAVWSNLHFQWLAIMIAAQLLAIPAYVRAYQAVARVHGGPALSLPLAVRVVTAGFGPFAVGGGFALDKRALCAIEDDHRASTVRVLGLGALEWALLAPAACISALVLLADGDPRPMKSLLWPWVIAVPIGFALGLTLAASRWRLGRGNGPWRSGVRIALDSVGILFSLAREIGSYWSAWVGIALYWVLDIAVFYGAVRFVGLHPNLAETVLAYATGYALTRRSMPLGGAGATEVLLTFSLHWVGQPVPASLAAVVVYRFFNFVLPAFPALLARVRVKPLLDAADEDRTPAEAASRRAAAPLLMIRQRSSG